MPVFQTVVELAVGMVANLISRTDDRGGCLSLGAPPRCERWPAHRLMAGATVGQAYQFDDVTEGTPLGRRPTGFDVGVIRVCADDQDSRRTFFHHVSISRPR